MQHTACTVVHMDQRKMNQYHNGHVCNKSSVKEVKNHEVSGQIIDLGINSTVSNDTGDVCFGVDDWFSPFEEKFDGFLNDMFLQQQGIGNDTIMAILCEIFTEKNIKPISATIECLPKPDAFNLCQDVMGTHTLRAFSWIISIFAIIGNLAQFVICQST